MLFKLYAHDDIRSCICCYNMNIFWHYPCKYVSSSFYEVFFFSFLSEMHIWGSWPYIKGQTVLMCSMILCQKNCFGMKQTCRPYFINQLKDNIG